MRRAISFLLGVAAILPACRDELVPREAPALVATSVDEGGDRVSPTAAIALSFSAALDERTVGPASILVVEGAADATLVRDLDDGAVTESRRARLVAGRVSLDGPQGARFEPQRPLAADSLHTLVVTTALAADGLRLPRPQTRAFTTGPASSGAPTWRLIDPPAGAAGVVRNLRVVEVAFSRPVDGVGPASLALVAEGGEAIAAAIEPIGGDRTRYRLLLGATLAAERGYQVVARPPIADDAGEPPFALLAPPGFSTGSIVREAPPSIQGAVAGASSGCLVARWVTDVAAVGRLCVESDCVEEEGRRTLHELGRPLAAGGGAAFTIAARDESTAPAAVAGPFAAPPSSPRTLTITEVLAHPRGPSPAQQFVEVWNRGALPVDLGGLELHDEMGWDVLPAATLAPGGYVIIAGSGFEADDGVDAAPDEAALIVRLADTRIGGNGLRQSGEMIGLFEADGRPVSHFSTYGVTVAAGQSVRRAASCDVAGAYQATPGGASTPGGS